ncbi:MAG: L-threonylcarbamoyladenylate synthase [Hyphomicrobium sp.]|nr:L-threonylcarbamoyladenylate synthase [Hyphomicrobium sp.]
MTANTRILRPDHDGVAEAARFIRAGQLVAMPTETVYGLAADATDGEAVARIFAAKGRPSFNPLIVHVPDLAAASELGGFDDTARRLAERFWPGPLTLVVPRAPGCPVTELATAGLDTIALRAPSHPVARALLAAAGRPLAAPSANRSGHVSATTATHVAADLEGRVAAILDGGVAPHGIESTIVGFDGDDVVLLRPGAISVEVIEAIVEHPLRRRSTGESRPNAPGQLTSHYAPRASLRLHATHAEPGEALLAFGPACHSTGMIVNLSPAGNLVAAAANLFSSLRCLDAAGVERVAVMPIPAEGLGTAINDRLHRAAAPKSIE